MCVLRVYGDGGRAQARVRGRANDACHLMCHAPNLGAVPSQRACSHLKGGFRVSARVGAGSRKERQPGLATGQCRASSRVTSHMESATLIGGSTPGREPTYYGPHVCTQGSRLWAKEMGAPGPKGPQKRARTDTQSSQTHRTPTRRST